MNDTRHFSPLAAIHRIRLVGGLLACVHLIGCGGGKYEERLKRSVDFYNYLTNMNSNLGGAWNRQDYGMTMRPPLPFGVPLPGPEIIKDQLGKESLGPDPRENTPLGIPLPGLIEGWAGHLDSSSEEPDVWMYILSNYSRFLEEEGEGRPPADFLTDLERDLMGVYQVTIPDGETSQANVNTRYRAQFPPSNSPGAAYATPTDHSVIQFVTEIPIRGKNLEGLLYERRVDKTQAAVLVILPKDAPVQLRQRVEMALATWSVDNVVPKRKNPNSPGSGARHPGF